MASVTSSCFSEICQNKECQQQNYSTSIEIEYKPSTLTVAIKDMILKRLKVMK